MSLRSVGYASPGVAAVVVAEDEKRPKRYSLGRLVSLVCRW